MKKMCRVLRRIKGYSSGLLEFTDDDIEYVRRKDA